MHPQQFKVQSSALSRSQSLSSQPPTINFRRVSYRIDQRRQTKNENSTFSSPRDRGRPEVILVTCVNFFRSQLVRNHSEPFRTVRTLSELCIPYPVIPKTGCMLLPCADLKSQTSMNETKFTLPPGGGAVIGQTARSNNQPFLTFNSEPKHKILFQWLCWPLVVSGRLQVRPPGGPPKKLTNTDKCQQRSHRPGRRQTTVRFRYLPEKLDVSGHHWTSSDGSSRSALVVCNIPVECLRSQLSARPTRFRFARAF